MPTISQIQNRVNALTSSNDAFDFAYLAVESANVSANLSFTVQCGCDLPDLTTVDVGSGTILFVEELQVPVYADVDCNLWAGLDRRVYRNDSPIQSRLFTWGINNYGQLGDGSTTNRSSPGTTAGGGTNWCQVSAGNCHTAALSKLLDSTLWTWGSNVCGRLGTGNTTNRSSPGTTAGGGTDWCQVSVGCGHTAAVKTNGTLWTWGCNGTGRLGDGTSTNRASPVTTAGGGINWCQVSAGMFNTAAVKQDGTLWTWGNNVYGRLGDGSTTSRSSPGTTAGGGTDWCQVSASDQYFAHTAAIKQDGTLWTWGYGSDGRLGDGTTFVRSSPGTTAGGGTNWSQVSAGGNHTAAVKQDGTNWTWGCNGGGQLGDGTTTNRSSPGTTAGGGTNWCQVSGGSGHTAAVKTDGTLWTWGCNSGGQLGDGSTTLRSSPGTTAGGGINWCQVSAGFRHTAAIQSS
jgi:alpha-tubulin suppressor-like RCC1 family protein